MGSIIKADREKCIGAGLCTVASEHFDIDATGKVELLTSGPLDGADLELVGDAVSMCPTEAIWLEQSESATT